MDLKKLQIAISDSSLFTACRQSGWACFAVLCGLAFFSLLALVLYRIWLHPLAHIPGPPLAKVSGYWRSKRYVQGSWHDDILEVHAKYGRVVRIAPAELSIVDEHGMRELYSHGKDAPKTYWYNTWEVPNSAPGLFATQNRKMHAFLRKRVSGAYSMSAIMKFEQYIQDCLDLLFDRLKKHADQGHVVNMSNWTNAFAFDVVGELAYGQQLGHLRTETDVMDLRKNIYGGFKIMASLGHYPFQGRLLQNPLVDAIVKLLGAGGVFGDFQEWSSNRVRDRLENLEKQPREDMLSHFCRMKAADGTPAAFGEILIEAMNIIGAGADTTSIGMRACLYYICSKPEVYKKLQQDIDRYYEENNLTAPVSYLQTQQIPYLMAVVKEATRLLPSIVYQLLRHAPDNFVVAGYSIPSGTKVGVSPLAQNRDKEIWGQDADEFRPERWLESEKKTRYFESANMTFGGSGPRMCIGRNIALVELHKFTAQFMHNFDFEIADKENPWKITTHWFAYQHDFNMKIRCREGRRLRCPATS